MDGAEPGRLIAGRYRLGVVIGHGGMGVVWRARDEVLHRDVAVKELIWPVDFTTRQKEQAHLRAIREARMAARLNHPNVVRIYDIIEADGHPWIVMEFLPFQSLRDRVGEGGPLTPAETAKVGLGVLAALRAAHAAGISHRDVKPANILVGPEDRVVLTDFGIARAADSPTLTTAGVLIGSPSYIAPERARGGRSGPPGDLWGLGASLYTAVEGRPPFERNGALASLTAVVADDPDPATHAGPLWPVISGLLRKDPDERLDAAETERMLRGFAPTVVPAITEPRARRPIVRRPIVRRPIVRRPISRRRASRTPAESAAAVLPPPVAEPASQTPAVLPPPVAEPANQAPASSAKAVAAPVFAPPAGPAPAEDASEDSVAAEPVLAEPAGAEPVLAEPAPAEDTPADGLELPWTEPAPGEPATAGPAPPVPATARSAAAVGGPTGPVSSGQRQVRRRRPAPAGIAVLAVIAAAATALALVLTSSPGRRSAASGGSTHPSAAPGSHSTTGTAPAGTSQPSASSSGSAAAAGSAAPPAGWYRFTNSTGFSIGVPDGWRISHVGHYVYITDPDNGGIFLLIDQSDQPKPNPLTDWEQQAAARESGYPDYHLIELRSVSYPQAEAAADWEFTYDRNGVMVQILNRNVLANADHAYALYWSTPVIDWTAYFHYFQSFAATFRPAPA